MLQPINSLCEKLQSDKILPHEVDFLVKHAVEQLRAMFVTPENLRNAPLSRFKSFCANVRKNGLWVPDSNTSFQMRNCKLSVLHKEMKTLTEFIISKFAERFESSSLLEHFKIFIPILYRHMPLNELEAFGWDSFKVLLQHFAGKDRGPSKLFEYNGQSMAAEFTAMKKAVWEKVNTLDIKDAAQLWGLLRDSSESLLFPKVLMMANIMFIIPVQTAVVERGFSFHRILKNRLTNRLKIMTLDSLLRIKLLTLKQKLEDFDFDAAAKAYTYVPIDKRDDIKLRTLFQHVNKIELGLLVDGIDGEVPEPDMHGVDAIVDGDAEDDVEVDGDADDDGDADGDAWLSDEEENAAAADVDCFGEKAGEEGIVSTAGPSNRGAELNDL